MPTPAQPFPVHPPGKHGGWGKQLTRHRLDWEAAMAYILLPPAAGVLLLITEHKSDYVRFHAWQSSLLFTFLAVSTPRATAGTPGVGADAI